MRSICGVASLAFICVTFGQTTATIDIDTTSTTPVNPHFSGVSTDLGLPVEFWDYRFNALAAQIGYGWVRFPGGNTSDVYNWQTGQEVPAWVAEFGGNAPLGDLSATTLVAGRGGAKLIDAANRANLFGVPLIYCINGFTDTVDSTAALAAWVNANNVKVAVWELSNEPYLYPQFFASASDYLNKMRPYRDAIKAAIPDAVIAVFARDPGNTGSGSLWDKTLEAYPSPYWDAITYHHYPPQSSGPFGQWMADQVAVLATNTTSVITGRFAQMGPVGVKFVNSEFNSTLGSGSTTGQSSLTDGTVWGGIYAAEYTMRMSTLPSVLHVGPNEITSYAGVFSTTNNDSIVTAAANAGTTIDTLRLNFGFYTSAQALGQEVLNGAINSAVLSNKTTVTGGTTVPATGISSGVPALYAMSYTNAVGANSVVITNKSSTPHQVTVRINGSAASGTFPLQYVAAADPGALNTGTAPNAVAIQSGSSANLVTIPPYSVVRIDVAAPAVATFVNAASNLAGALAPQQLVLASGTGFASQRIDAPPQALAPTLGDTKITITDSNSNVVIAPLVFVSPTQAEFQIPQNVASGKATATVTRSGNTVLTGTLTIAASSPGIFSANGNGAGTAAAFAIAIEPLLVQFKATFSCAPGVEFGCLSLPVSFDAASQRLFVFLEGTGIRGAQSVTAFVGGLPVPVSVSPRSDFQGVDSIVIFVPAYYATWGETSVYIIADGTRSNMTTLYFQ